MNKWDRYKSYENWKYSNDGFLKNLYKEYSDNYTPGDECDGMQSYDDFCMGQWQWLD